MKILFLIPILLCALVVNAQSLPKAVEKAFEAQFPNTEITGWKDNNTYDPSGLDEDGRDAASEEAKKLGIKDPQDPTEFYIYFDKEGTQWYSKFLLDGTFVIAHGRIASLPKKVLDAIDSEFKGGSIKIGNDIQKAIVPSSQTPIYRVFVSVKHGERHTVKVNGNGKIIANTTK